jgi:hypothetical protein
MDLRVASNLASFQRPWRFSISGSPRFSISPVAPLDASPGHPGYCTFRPCRRPISRFPRISCPSAPLARPPRVCPVASLFQVAPADEFPESPQFLHLPAVPATDLRVTPNLSSFGVSVLEFSVALEPRSSAPPPDEAASFPARFILRLGLWFDSPSFPESSPLWLRLMDSRVSPVLAPSGFAAPAFSGFPESCIYGWVR